MLRDFPLTRWPFTLLVAVLAAFSGAAADASNVTVSAAYYDNEHPSPVVPNPWLGSPNTTFFGGVGANNIFDTGAVMFRNNGPTNAVLAPGFKVDGFNKKDASFQLWDGLIGAGAVIAPGKILILAQTTSSNYDSSDQPIINNKANRTNDMPVVHFTIDGVHYNFVDTTQIINTGGFDPGEALVISESTAWTLLGSTAVPEPSAACLATLALFALIATARRR